MKVIAVFGITDDTTVVHYDADGVLIGTVMHLDGMLIEPVTLERGEALYAYLPGGEPTFGGRLTRPSMMPLAFNHLYCTG